jgi:hypothetical protein
MEDRATFGAYCYDPGEAIRLAPIRVDIEMEME